MADIKTRRARELALEDARRYRAQLLSMERRLLGDIEAVRYGIGLAHEKILRLAGELDDTGHNREASDGA